MSDKIKEIKKAQKKYQRNAIFCFCVSFLLVFCGIFFVFIPVLFFGGRFFAVFLLSGVLITLFFPVFFFYLGKIQNQKFLSFAHSQFLLDFTFCYDSFSFYFDSKDSKKTKTLLKRKEKMVSFSFDNYRGKMKNIFFSSLSFFEKKKRIVVLTYSLSYSVPFSFLIVQKGFDDITIDSKKYPYSFLSNDFVLYSEKKERFEISSLLDVCRKEKISAISFSRQDCQIYFEKSDRKDSFSLFRTFDEKDVERIEKDYKMAFDLFQELKLEE